MAISNENENEVLREIQQNKKILADAILRLTTSILASARVQSGLGQNVAGVMKNLMESKLRDLEIQSKKKTGEQKSFGKGALWAVGSKLFSSAAKPETAATGKMQSLAMGLVRGDQGAVADLAGVWNPLYQGTRNLQNELGRRKTASKEIDRLSAGNYLVDDKTRKNISDDIKSRFAAARANERKMTDAHGKPGVVPLLVDWAVDFMREASTKGEHAYDYSVKLRNKKG